LAADLLARFPNIDELINDAGNLTLGGELLKTSEDINDTFSGNVVDPLMLVTAPTTALKQLPPLVRYRSLPVDRLFTLWT